MSQILPISADDGNTGVPTDLSAAAGTLLYKVTTPEIARPLGLIIQNEGASDIFMRFYDGTVTAGTYRFGWHVQANSSVSLSHPYDNIAYPFRDGVYVIATGTGAAGNTGVSGLFVRDGR